MRGQANNILRGIVLLLIVWQLFVPPVLSVANDHDFEKILGRSCLGPVDTLKTPYFDYAVLRYTYDPNYCIDWPMRTANELTFRVGVWLDRVLFSKSEFDLRAMGIVYGAIFFLGFLTLQKAGCPATVQALWILIVCNAAWIPIFNTLYFDALSVASLTGALAAIGVVALDAEAGAGWIATAGAWLAVLAASKGQHGPMALLFVPLLWFGAKHRILRAAGTVAVIAGAWLSIGTMPSFYQGEATFNALFYRILPTVQHPEALLKETKIPPDWSQYTGKVAFAEDVPLRDPYYEEQFGKWFGAADLIGLYFRHPSIAWLMARENLDESSMDRVRIRMAGVPHRLSNYEESVGKPPQAISHFFTVWPAIKDAVFGARPLAWLVWILFVISAGWALAPPDWRFRALLTSVKLALVAEFAIAMLDGADGGRHLTIFCLLLDLVFCFDVALFLRRRAISGTERSLS